MSIRLIAKDLYRLRQEVERLETELAAAPMEKKEAIKSRLRQALADATACARHSTAARIPLALSAEVPLVFGADVGGPVCGCIDMRRHRV